MPRAIQKGDTWHSTAHERMDDSLAKNGDVLKNLVAPILLPLRICTVTQLQTSWSQHRPVLCAGSRPQKGQVHLQSKHHCGTQSCLWRPSGIEKCFISGWQWQVIQEQHSTAQHIYILTLFFIWKLLLNPQERQFHGLQINIRQTIRIYFFKESAISVAIFHQFNDKISGMTESSCSCHHQAQLKPKSTHASHLHNSFTMSVTSFSCST